MEVARGDLPVEPKPPVGKDPSPPLRLRARRGPCIAVDQVEECIAPWRALIQKVPNEGESAVLAQDSGDFRDGCFIVKPVKRLY